MLAFLSFFGEGAKIWDILNYDTWYSFFQVGYTWESDKLTVPYLNMLKIMRTSSMICMCQRYVNKKDGVIGRYMISNNPAQRSLFFTGTWYSMSCHNTVCHVIMPCLIMPCHAMPCHAMPCHAVPCHVMPCHVMQLECMLLTSHDILCHCCCKALIALCLGYRVTFMRVAWKVSCTCKSDSIKQI